MALTDEDADLIRRSRGFLIGGEHRVPADGPGHRHCYPGNGAETGLVPLASAADVDDAVAAARAGFRAWQALGPDGRRAAMLRLADLYETHADELARLMVIDIGTPLAFTAWTGRFIAEHYRYYAGWADKVGGEVVPTWQGPALDYAVDEPYGVIGVILPWNGPAGSLAMVGAPALAAGNALVVKPPEAAPYQAMFAAHLFALAGFPPGVVNVVVGGPEAGQAMSRHPGIDKLHFTGSGGTARHILATAHQVLKPVDLELGGKSANIVFEDADLDRAVGRVVGTATMLSGQVCTAGTRVLVHDSIHDEFVRRCRAALAGVAIGDPMDPATAMGPLASATACEAVLGHIDRAVSQNAGKLVCGGRRLGGELASGYFVGPTLFEDVDPDSALARLEVFGPVLALMRFGDEAEAIRLANDSEFGLAAHVQTTNLSRAHRVAAGLEAGIVFINGFPGSPPMSAPFGGVKQSGWGRIGGKAGIGHFTRSKNVWIDLS